MLKNHETTLHLTYSEQEEIIQRMRRMETRLVSLMAHLGMEVPGRKDTEAAEVVL